MLPEMKEKTISSKMVFDGKLLKVEVQEVELAGGIRSIREIVRHPGAIAVLSQLPDGRYVFVSQYRKPIEKDLLEVVAGTLEPGEDPEECAKRELIEETGYTCDSIRKLSVLHLAPGYSTEEIHLYYALLKPEQAEACPDDDEKLDVVYLSAKEVESMISGGEIEDAKTLAAWLLHKVPNGRD